MNKIKISGFAAALLLIGAFTASAAQKIVSFDPSFKSNKRVEVIESIGGTVKKEFHIIEALVAVFPDHIKNAGIYSLDGVRGVEEDLYTKWIEEAPAALPLSHVTDSIAGLNEGVSDIAVIPSADEPRPLADQNEIPWGVKRVNAPGAWNTTMGENVKVAVVDTGIDYEHPDLKELYSGGYNAITQGAAPLDDQGHGTHVSGTIAAVKDLKGVVGIAPKVKLYGVKVLDANGSGSYSTIIDGIEWAVDNGMDVINMSLGGRSGTDALAKAMAAADKAGVTIVCAAGNDSGPVNYPAKYPQAIAVAASDSSDRIASFSSRGAEIAFIAPGVRVYSTYKGSAYRTMDGTSMAAPHVAGLAALAVARGADTPAKVRASLKRAAASLGLPPAQEGSGMIDAAKLTR